MKISAFYVGSSLLSPLKQAEQTIVADYGIKVLIKTYNLGGALNEAEWAAAEADLIESSIVFVFHVVDGENSSRLLNLLAPIEGIDRTVIVVNCMPDLMRCTQMGRLQFSKFFGKSKGKRSEAAHDFEKRGRARRLFSSVSGWMGEQVKGHKNAGRRNHTQYLKYIERLPSLLRVLPVPGPLRDVKHYLNIFCYFLQPTPANIRSMVLYAIKYYGPREEIGSAKLKYSLPETLPAIAIYHPEATGLFESYESYSSWHEKRPGAMSGRLEPSRTVGLLLMRPQIVSNSKKHYDGLIRAIEREGLSVIPAISTFMDNRISCEKFFFTGDDRRGSVSRENDIVRTSRVSQVVSLTGFSFVGGPAMNDSEAALGFLKDLNRPFKSIVSLDTQTIGKWELSGIGLNPVQSGMQVAIPEIDGATEPFIYGGLPDNGTEPVPLPDRCLRIARRLKRWNRLQVADRADLKIALMLFCFPPDKGNIGTAADLDVIPSVMAILEKLRADGYSVEVPASPEELRQKLIEGNSESYGTSANVAYAMGVDEYSSLCPYVDDIEAEWGIAPGRINSFAGKVLIHGFQAGNVFIAVQPSFGYEGDPMRMLMARSGAPHHGFMALYTFLEKIFRADAVIHVGTHGALEFMPGKQVGLSSSCWPDRLIGELPNLYIYSVNNPSEGTIAKRRSYAELISYLTPPIENAGLYRELETMKELICSYRMSGDEVEKSRLYAAIQNAASSAHFGDLSL